MQELQAVNRLTDVFLHALSHDLRTTVMGTLLILNSLQAQPEDKPAIARPILMRMIQGGEHQLNRLNALLDAYTSYTQGLTLEREKVDLNSLVQSLLQDLQPCWLRNRIEFTAKIAPDLPCLNADPKQLRRVFEHLLTNAAKHNPPGIGLTLNLSVIADGIYCSVQDNGAGIPPSQRDRLFELCIGDADSTHQLTGVRLGLYLCDQIIRAHGGQIGVQSQPGVGSTFWFTLPVTVSVELRSPPIALGHDSQSV
jgi:signal transduction histidine kinase